MILSGLTLGALALFSSVVTTDLATLSPEPTSVLASCESPLDFQHSFLQAMLDDGTQTIKLERVESGFVKLVSHDQKYDIRLEDYTGKLQWSARQSGASISQLLPNATSYHVMLNRGHGEVEHFLFSLQLDGSGEMMWSSANRSAHTSCTS